MEMSVKRCGGQCMRINKEKIKIRLSCPQIQHIYDNSKKTNLK